MPASKPDVNLCKNILSSTLSSFPTSTLINWGQNFDDEKLVFGGSHIAKLQGVHDYLSGLDASQEDDMVLLVDGYDIWFQLDARVLLARYNAINRKADLRINKDLGAKVAHDHGIKQSIVFSSQKKCWPGDSGDPWCYAVPPSPLPADLYGSDTDIDMSDADEKYTFARHRQRYLNSGIAMGPVREMRAMFARALDLWEEDPSWGSDQAIFAKIFGLQEYQRVLLKEQYDPDYKDAKVHTSRNSDVPLTRRTADSDKAPLRHSSILDQHPTHRKPDLQEGVNYEFGIGLDYESALGQPTVFADFDLDWVVYSDREALERSWTEKNVSHPASDCIEQDIVKYSPQQPFANISASSDEKWEDMPLFSNLWTGVTPALIHHNAHRDGLKSNRETMWDMTWFQPRARDLLAARLTQKLGSEIYPFAVEYVDTVSKFGNHVRRKGKAWWDAGTLRGREAKGFAVRTDRVGEDGRFEWIGWNGLCDEAMQEEVFRDGKGMFDDSDF